MPSPRFQRVFEAGCALDWLLECESRAGLGCLRAVMEIAPPRRAVPLREGGWAPGGLARELLPCRLAAAVGKAVGESRRAAFSLPKAQGTASPSSGPWR